MSTVLLRFLSLHRRLLPLLWNITLVSPLAIFFFQRLWSVFILHTEGGVLSLCIPMTFFAFCYRCYCTYCYVLYSRPLLVASAHVCGSKPFHFNQFLTLPFCFCYFLQINCFSVYFYVRLRFLRKYSIVRTLTHFNNL